jgi:cytochrome bd-type quinol oxidase subunit 2
VDAAGAPGNRRALVHLPNLFWFLPVPILVLVTLYGLIRAVARNAHYTPFLLTLVLIFLGYSGLGISLWPNIIPPSISIWDAAAPPQSQGFMLVGTLFIIPFILGTPSGATTCSAARSPMKTAITRSADVGAGLLAMAP